MTHRDRSSFEEYFLSSASSTQPYSDESTQDDSRGFEDLTQLKSKIHESVQFYKEENAKFMSLFKNCKLLNDFSLTLNCNSNSEKILEELCDIQEVFGTKNLSAAALSMTYMDKILNNNSDYVERVKLVTGLYIKLNEKLSQEIDTISSELEEHNIAVNELFNLSSEEIYALEKKVASYESELAKFERKYSWLKNPQLDLIYISKETHALQNVQEEKDALEKHLQHYQGLKPDLREATSQLNEVKKQYEKLKAKFRSQI